MKAETRRRIEEQIDVPRNVDGDSVGDMRAVWDKHGFDSIEHIIKGYKWVTQAGDGWIVAISENQDNITNLRITAKHADKFQSDCMDFEVWQDACVDRNMVKKVVCKNGYTEYYNENMDGERTHTGCLAGETWTAITPAQYAEETAPKPKWNEPKVKPERARYTTERTNGVNLVIDRNDGDRAMCLCPHSKFDAYNIAAALNAKVAK